MNASPLRILITGAGRAIGHAAAAELAARGHEVIATARDVGAADPIEGVRFVTLDVNDPASRAAALEAAGPIDVLVNNAALAGAGPLEDFPLDRLRSMVETNTLAPLAMIQAVVPSWRERGSGVIVNVSSVQGRVGSPLEGPYCATKFALEGLSEALHYELSHFGIRTVIVQPGYIAPGMKASPRHDGPDVYAELWNQWDGTSDTVTGGEGRTPPEVAARVIADAIEDPETPLRVRIGGDAEFILDAWKQLSDAEFEAAMRATLGLTW